ncbi:sodium:solute symporter [Schlesneria paludicola]|uniref:sodium:solute symporter n=1 Tax=Schlesneria paludicola TaxID=360056 RepID=UPI0003074488|nr:sodium:solute symporter [Schlesneria paludicola]
MPLSEHARDHTLDIAVLAIYLVAVVGYGCWFAWRTKTSEQFMSAGRSIPGWAVGLSIFGSYISSISFMANPGKSYKDNWNAFVFAISMPLAIWLSVKYFVPFYRRSGHLSAYEHFEERFGAWARTYAVVCFLLTQLARLGMILYMLALAFEPLVGIDVKTIIIVSGIAITLYPFLGGTEGVIWTGVVQSIVLVAGVIVCLIAVMLELQGGFGELFKVAIENNKFSLGKIAFAEPNATLSQVWYANISQSTFWVVLVMGMVTHLQNFGIDQAYIQRYVTAKSDADAGRSVWLGGLCFIPLSAAFFFIGTALFVLYVHQRPGEIPVGTKPEGVLPYFIGHELPPGVMGLVLAAVFSAAMDSNLNCCATLYLCDIHRRYLRPNASERESMMALHASTLVMGALSILTALGITQINSAALDIWWKLVGILSGGVLGLFLLGVLSRRATSFHAAIGVIFGAVVIVWMTFSPIWKTRLEANNMAWLVSPFHDNLILVVGTLTILLVGLAVSRFSVRQTRDVRISSGENLETIQEPAT